MKKNYKVVYRLFIKNKVGAQVPTEQSKEYSYKKSAQNFIGKLENLPNFISAELIEEQATQEQEQTQAGDRFTSQLVFIDKQIMYLSKVYNKKGVLIDYELIHSDGASTAFCDKWGKKFTSVNESPITLRSMSEYNDLCSYLNSQIGYCKHNKDNLYYVNIRGYRIEFNAQFFSLNEAVNFVKVHKGYSVATIAKNYRVVKTIRPEQPSPAKTSWINKIASPFKRLATALSSLF